MAEKKSKKIIKEPKVVNRIKTFYDTEAIDALMKRFNYKSIMEVPKINKIVLNMRLGDIKDNAKSLQSAVKELELIAGQKAVICNAKMSVANFKLRTGMPVGAKVTLRSDKMWHFLEKLIAVALPRVRDFRGLSTNSFDGRGNYSLGIKEQLVFPEIIYDDIEKVRGFDISIITTAKTDEEAKELLTLLGMPFARR